VKYYTNKARQAGMTLIELTVVLLVLIGLAGLMIPYVGSFVQKTSDSTSSNNLAQLNNATMRFTVDKNRLPHHLESLINDTAATVGTATGACVGAVIDEVYCGLQNNAVFTATTYAAGTDDIAIASLASSGLEMFVNSNPDTSDKTFNSTTGMYYLPTQGPAGDGSDEAGIFAVVNAGGAASARAHLADALGGAGMDYSTTCYDYIGFGIGDRNELIGNTMTSAPVTFPEDATLGPVQRYGHYIAIVQVDKSNTASDMMTGACSEVTEKAKFLGTVMNVPASVNANLMGVGQALGQAYTNQAAAGN